MKGSDSPADIARTRSQFMQRAGEEDHVAFEALYLHRRQSIFSFVARRCRSLDNAAVEDVVAEVFLRVWQAHERLSSVKNLHAYLNGIARNVIARRLRDQRITEYELFPHVASLAPGSCELLEKDEIMRRISQAITSLKESHRIAVELSQKGLSSKQIAAQIGCTEKAVQRRLEKSKKKLRLALSDCAKYMGDR